MLLQWLADLRARSTISYPGLISAMRSAMAALRIRLARLRFTAFPIDFPAVIPTLIFSVWFGRKTNTTSGWAKALPCCRTRWKSLDFLRRNCFSTSYFMIQRGPAFQTTTCLWLLAIPVGFLDVFVHPYSQAVASFETASFEYITPAARGHPLSETVYTDASSFLGLVCSFRHFSSSF